MNNKESNFNTLKWIYKRTKKYFPLILFNAFLAVIVSLSYIALALLSKNVLDIATGNLKGEFSRYAFLLVAVIIIQIICSGADTYSSNYATGKLVMHLRKHLFTNLSKKKFSAISQYHSGDFLNRITSDTDVLVSTVAHIIPSISSMIAKIIGGISTLIILDARVALIILMFGVTVPALGRIINKRFKALHKNCQKSEGDSRSFMQECFENIVVVKTFQGISAFTDKLMTLLRKNFRFKMKRNILSIVTNLSLYTFFTIGYYAVLLWGAGEIASGAITYGTLMAFLQLVQQLRAPMQNISGIVPQYYTAIASAERLMEIENLPDEIKGIDPEKISQIEAQFNEINISNVTFAYNDELILNDCSFSIPRGKITALTGESGSGKSTVFKILLGLYDIQSGKITVNNDIPLNSSLRGLFAYVPQGNLVLSGTIRENLTLCNPNVKEDELIAATKTAEIYDLITSMPEGFDTVLAERGAGLSEGQIQRISIARALLTQAPILLLDEATSALDEETETKVLANIKNSGNKTILFITHRNTSLKVCDRIVHVENKKFSLIKE